MFLPKNASRIRQREAQNARNNRAEIVKALSLGQVTRRDLVKWGAFTATGALAWKHGLNPFVKSAFADVPTGTPRSPLFGAQKFTVPMPRLATQQPIPLTRNEFGHAEWPAHLNEVPAVRLSYHTAYNLAQQIGDQAGLADFTNPITGRGPIEGRPPGEFSPTRGGTSTSPRSATSCPGAARRRAPASIRLSRTSASSTPTRCGPGAPAVSWKAPCRRRS
jgi:hypothetical protein